MPQLRCAYVVSVQKCAGKADNPYGFPFVSECVGGSLPLIKPSCKDSAAPVPCGDGSCQPDYVSCLRVMSARDRADAGTKTLRYALLPAHARVGVLQQRVRASHMHAYEHVHSPFARSRCRWAAAQYLAAAQQGGGDEADAEDASGLVPHRQSAAQEATPPRDRASGFFQLSNAGARPAKRPAADAGAGAGVNTGKLGAGVVLE